MASQTVNPSTTYARYLPQQLHDLPWRAHALDGKLLLFDQNVGFNMLLEGKETLHLQRVAPRTLLVAVTSFCNLSCPFCYRDMKSVQSSRPWGVLEVAFGGGA